MWYLYKHTGLRSGGAAFSHMHRTAGTVLQNSWLRRHQSIPFTALLKADSSFPYIYSVNIQTNPFLRPLLRCSEGLHRQKQDLKLRH